jgi:hypothetical protein
MLPNKLEGIISDMARGSIIYITAYIFLFVVQIVNVPYYRIVRFVKNYVRRISSYLRSLIANKPYRHSGLLAIGLIDVVN